MAVLTRRSRPLVVGGNGTATRRVPGRATADCRRQPRSVVAVGAERERCRVGDPARGQRRGLPAPSQRRGDRRRHPFPCPRRRRTGRVVRDEAALYDAVLIAFATREQGLLVAPGNPLSLAGVAEVGDRQLRLAVRPEGAGAQQLLLGLLQRHRLSLADAGATVPAHTGPDVAQAIRADRADCGIATRAVATAAGVGFLPLCLERFDLLLRQRDYFRPAWQSLLKFCSPTRGLPHKPASSAGSTSPPLARYAGRLDRQPIAGCRRCLNARYRPARPFWPERKWRCEHD